jgi:hypothetical protein
MRLARRLAVLSVGLLTVACGDPATSDPATSDPATTDPATAVETTPTTAVPAPATTTTLPVVDGGWTLIDGYDGYANYPCCADTWYGVPSPELPANSGPLADGDYPVEIQWSEDPTAPVRLLVRRFDLCSSLPQTACEQPPIGYAFGPDQMGIDGSVEIELVVPLDEHLGVVLTGFWGWGSALPNQASGNGADLAELARAIESAYATVVAPRIAALTGDDDVYAHGAEAVVRSIVDHPEGGFGPGTECVPDIPCSSLSFTHGSAPPILMQAPYGRDETGQPIPMRGTDFLRAPSVHIDNGVITLFVFGGRMS